MKRSILTADSASKAFKATLLSATLISSGVAVVKVAHAAPPAVIAHFHADAGAGKSVSATPANNARTGLLAGLAAAAAAAAGLFRLLAPKHFRAAVAKAGEVATKAAKSAAGATKTAAAAVGRITKKTVHLVLLGAGGIGAFFLALNSFDGNGWAGDAAAGFTFGALAATTYFLGRALFRPRQKAKILVSEFTEKQ